MAGRLLLDSARRRRRAGGRRLASGCARSTWRPRSTGYARCGRGAAEASPAAAARTELPALLRGYLRLGAWVCGEPAHDPDFGVADLYVLLSMRRVDPRYLRHFLSLVPGRDERLAARRALHPAGVRAGDGVPHGRAEGRAAAHGGRVLVLAGVVLSPVRRLIPAGAVRAGAGPSSGRPGCGSG